MLWICVNIVKGHLDIVVKVTLGLHDHSLASQGLQCDNK